MFKRIIDTCCQSSYERKRVISGCKGFLIFYLFIHKGDLYVNGESKLVERDLAFDGGVAFGVDKALVPLGFGGSCDEIKETQITVILF